MQPENDQKPGSELFDITSLDTYVLLNLFVSILATKAWQHLGLRTASGSNTVKRDLAQARMSIDCISFLINQLKDKISAEESKRQLNLLTDLQMNFARIANESIDTQDSESEGDDKL
ncbi:MAG: DUF1844 domain-containing protein [Candidatus Bathyarchaeota archaeon]|nr:DUF1844 domain-containing protein [Candidatus Bathyarchaeota archaeon]